MITFNEIGYMGRLGNQMFQYATLLGVAHKANCIPGIPLTNQSIKPEGCLDKFTQQWIPYKLDLLDGFDLKIKDSSIFKVNHHKEESFHHFDNSFFSIEDNTNIKGYFQTEKYFKHIESTIKDVFTFKPEIIQQASSILDQIPRNKVSLHFRRGDYLGDQHLFPVLDLNYYQKAINEFTDKDYNFVILSDDINWCKKSLGEDKRILYIENTNQFIDMCIMTMCDHNIIANSTFSWWGAWLNSNPNKKVIAPDTWFGPGLNHLNTEDIVPHNWIKIC